MIKHTLLKKCYKCGEFKELENFCKDKTKKDGLNSRCKKCTRDSIKKCWESNKVEIIDKVVKYDYIFNKAKLDKLPKEIVIEAINTSTHFIEVANKILPGDSYFRGKCNLPLKIFVEENDINISHFKRLEAISYTIGNKGEVFKENTKRSRKILKRLLLENNIIEDKCNICNSLPIWRGEKLVLRLDHINGDTNDNRIENLRLICPNCDSQTKHFCGRNKGRYK